MLERSLSIYETYFDSDHPETANAMANLGAVCVAVGNRSLAKDLLERALKI